MPVDIQPYLHSLVVSVFAIVAILNPFGNLPQFLTMTDGFAASTRQKLFRKIIYTAFAIVIIFMLTGPFIMEYLFRIHIKDLRMAGGLTLIVMGIKNLLFPMPNRSTLSTDEETDDEIIRKSIIPMAFPMMVGPGTLATVIILSNDDGMIVTLIAAFVAFLFMFILFHFSASIERVFGKLVLHVLSRIMQVFIISMGVRMIVDGIKETMKYLTV